MPLPTDPKQFPFTHWRTISFGDTDAAAIVYTTRFTDYCMQAVEVWFKQYIGVDWYWINVRDRRGTPVVHLEMDFFGPLIAGDELGVTLAVSEVGRSTLKLALEGRKQGDQDNPEGGKIFSANYVFCFVDTDKNRAIAIPQESLDRVRYYIRQCEARQQR